ncbi:hypothetical protein NPIL_477241 [Nephila pilipes]|uniref:Uncharacterized protein n=1 Tax=Nephila pilipes TaxID=299642 RepID=A0A8X6PUV7_NEPPI|nr:hypothetical protein NPIL_477241 [Nephila pilipes]
MSSIKPQITPSSDSNGRELGENWDELGFRHNKIKPFLRKENSKVDSGWRVKVNTFGESLAPLNKRVRKQIQARLSPPLTHPQKKTVQGSSSDVSRKV